MDQQRTDNPIDEFFSVLSAYLDPEIRELPSLHFGESTDGDVKTVLGAHFPLQTTNEITTKTSFEENYAFVQANYEYIKLTFKFGAERDRWQDRLFEAALSVETPSTRLKDRETRAFRTLTEFYGDYTTIAAMEHWIPWEEELEFDEDIDVYIWQLPHSVVRYRNVWQMREGEGASYTVVEYWDRNFFEQFPVFKYA